MTQGSTYRSCTLESVSLIVLPRVSQWLWNASQSDVFVAFKKSARKDAVKRETRGWFTCGTESYTCSVKINAAFMAPCKWQFASCHFPLWPV